jgi:hypothetical protein
VRQGWLGNNPVRLLEPIEGAPSRPTGYFDREEFEKFVVATDSLPDSHARPNFAIRLRTMLLLRRWSGLRLGDAVTLERSRLNAFGYPQRAVPALKTALWGFDLYHTRFVLEQSTHDGLAKVPLLRDFLHREDNALYRYMRKRKSFEHERELRALIQHLPSAPDPSGSAAQILIRQPNPEHGRFIPVRLAKLLEKVYVAPTAPVWFRELVLHITAKYGLKLPVERKRLTNTPVRAIVSVLK